MAVENVPWLIGRDGVLHSAEVGRALAYAAANAADGVVGSTDLKIAATSTPGNSVTVAPGAVNIINRYPGATSQAYTGVVTTQTPLAIAPTNSSGGRSDAIVARVRDPQYGSVAGYDPNNPNAFQFFSVEVMQNVGSGFRGYTNPGYPVVALARIDIPSSTATITNAMITDLREKAMPRSFRKMYLAFPQSTSSLGTNTAEWLTSGRPMVSVPPWATRCNLIAHFTAVEKVVAGYVRSQIKLSVGGQSTEWVSMTQNTPIQRFSFSLGGSVDIPPAQRGTVVPLSVRGVINVGPNGAFELDTESGLTFDVEFVEDVE